MNTKTNKTATAAILARHNIRPRRIAAILALEPVEAARTATKFKAALKTKTRTNTGTVARSKRVTAIWGAKMGIARVHVDNRARYRKFVALRVDGVKSSICAKALDISTVTARTWERYRTIGVAKPPKNSVQPQLDIHITPDMATITTNHSPVLAKVLNLVASTRAIGC